MRQFILILFMVVSFCGYAQKPQMATLFKEMPDSLMPYLTKNNRLDMIDFMEAGMKAEVTNAFDGRSEMTLLTADSLSLRMNDVLSVEMTLIHTDEPIDSSSYVISVKRTYLLNEKQAECVIDIYTSAWRCLSSSQKTSTLLRRDDDLEKSPYL